MTPPGVCSPVVRDPPHKLSMRPSHPRQTVAGSRPLNTRSTTSAHRICPKAGYVPLIPRVSAMLRFHPLPVREQPVKTPPARASAPEPMPPSLTGRQPSREENPLHDASAFLQQDAACRRRCSHLNPAPQAALHDALLQCPPRRTTEGTGPHEGEGSCRG